LVVFLWFHGFPQRHECEQIQNTNYQAFSNGEGVKLSKG